MSYYKCELCGSPVRIMLQTTIVIPGDLAHKMTKHAYRRKDVELWGCNWDCADFICTNPKCRKVTNGYGNYVKNLEQKVKELESKLEFLITPKLTQWKKLGDHPLVKEIENQEFEYQEAKYDGAVVINDYRIIYPGEYIVEINDEFVGIISEEKRNKIFKI